ncbi:sigma-70 family RNA polymerase sigma factor [Limibacter armeniacum]|uniref:RNA polymerase sigma factor n=1 Tax=Limibacter armeniacum TaxID=466084 RepID=UPI002FE55CC0
MNDNEHVCEEKVFNELFRKYAKEIHDFLYYKYGESNNPSDLVQEAFIKLWDNCQKVIPSKARAFLYTVANNQMLNELSKKKTVLKYQQQDQKQYSNESPEFVMQEKEYTERLKAAIEDLTEEQRIVFMLNRIDGKKHQEIADMLNISRKAVEKRLYKAIDSLKKKMEIAEKNSPF